MKLICLSIIFALITISCSSPFLKYEEPQGLSIDEGLPEVKVKEIGEDPNVAQMNFGAIENHSDSPPVPDFTESLSNKKKELDNLEEVKKRNKNKNKKKEFKSSSISILPVTPNQLDPKVNSNILREPRYESDIGFNGGSRRPIRDPFRIGEKVVLSVRYFTAQAGELTLEIRPPVEVNGRKSYRWLTGLKTTGIFSSFYSVDDWAETLVDYETLAPSIYNLHVKESGQLKNGRGYFDSKTLKGVYIEKKYSEEKGHEEKKHEWQVLPYAQNVFSAAYYMRIFSFEVGKEYKFTVANEEKNLMFRGKALRKEHVETDAGEFNTIVIKPEFEIGGVFKPVGDIFFWLTDDDRKLIVRIESKIKIGTLVMEAIQIDRGID